MKKQNEVRYIVTSVASIPVYKIGSKTEAYKLAAKPGWGTVDWDEDEKELFCDEGCSADLYTKNGGYFGIYPYEEINRKEMPKQAACAAILTSDADGNSFWAEDTSLIHIFVTYDENGLIDTYHIEYGADMKPEDGETELTFEDLFVQPEGDWREAYRAEIPGTVQYQNKQEAAALAQEAGTTWMDDEQREQFRRVCGKIDRIKSAWEFLVTMQSLEYDYDKAIIDAARKFKKCFNFEQYEQPKEVERRAEFLECYKKYELSAAEEVADNQQDKGTAAEAASKGRETALGTPEKMAGTDATGTAGGQQAAPQGREINLGTLEAGTSPGTAGREPGKQPGGP